MPAFLIRSIEPRDSATVAHIIRTVMPEFGADGPGFAIHDTEVDDMHASYTRPRSVYFVVERDGVVIGGGGIAPLQNGEPGVCELRKMYFLPEARGIGAGTAMMQRCLDAARNFGFKRCYIETLTGMDAAQMLYRKHGFKALCEPMGGTGHFGCDRFFILELQRDIHDMIRIARAEDAQAIHAIYAPAVDDTAITFETEHPGVEAMRQRIITRLQHYPWLVWEENGQVLAYAYATRFRERAAYDWIAETSIYVHADARRRGIARKLYNALLDVMRLQGINQAVGVITLPGDISVALHEAMGFTPAGVWRKAGYKLGRWWDVGVWQRELQTPANPPIAVTVFPDLLTPALRDLGIQS
jgi:L-amino acid N-acyltransferase YncA